jgi:hypothetical protein
MSFKCIKCDKIFEYKHHLNNHLNKKKSCEKNNNDQNIFKCLLCDKEYSYKTGLIRHNKTHKNYDEEVEKLKEKNNEIEQLKELFITQNEMLHKQIELLNKKIENMTNNTINNTTNNTINNTNITNNTTNLIIAFGNEDYENLNKDEIKKILFDKKVDPLLRMIEYTHFNDRLPQQQNIKYNNLRSKSVDIHDGQEWIMYDLDKVLDDLIDNNIYSLDRIYKSTKERKSNIKIAVKNIIDDYNKHYVLDTEERSNKDNKNIIDNMIKTKNDVKLCIYTKTRNNRKNTPRKNQIMIK